MDGLVTKAFAHIEHRRRRADGASHDELLGRLDP
jgi:hypothetical protein